MTYQSPEETEGNALGSDFHSAPTDDYIAPVESLETDEAISQNGYGRNGSNGSNGNGKTAIATIPVSEGASAGSSSKLLLGIALGVCLAFVGSRVLDKAFQEKPAEAPAAGAIASASVTVARSQSIPIKQTITANGTVEAFDLLSVAPRASGLQIQSVSVREGDYVSAGQVLAVLDDSVLRSQIAQAEAQVSAVIADVAQREAQVAQAEASLAEARENLSRYETLFAQGAVSEEVLTSRRTAVSTAEQTVSANTAAISSAQATVQSRRAEVSRLTTQLDQTFVLAPSDGIIAEKTATVGDTASTSTPLFSLISGDQLELAVQIPQSQMAKVNPGSAVQITSESDPNLQLQGQIRAIDPIVNPQTRQATIKIGLPGSDRLRPGMFLQAGIVTGSRQGVVIPATALIPQASGGFTVFTVDDNSLSEADGTTTGSVRARTVDVGSRLPARSDFDGGQPATVEITAGLDAETSVVVDGASYLQDGDVVGIVSDFVSNADISNAETGGNE
ncbi:MAG: efflux RND transporter periplasmic adaptor subunit [Cyanobacteria bacterium J06554_3]